MFSPTALLGLSVEPGLGGFVSGSGAFAVGSQQVIAAIAAPGWTFAGWNDGNTDNPRTVLVPAGGATYTAQFSSMTELVVLIDPPDGGTTTGSGTYLVGSEQPIAATAAPGWLFTGWSDGSLENPRTVLVPAGGATYTARFSSTAELVVLIDPPGGGSATGSASYTVGSEQVIAAVPARGWIFAGWNDGSLENPRLVTVPAGGATFTAAFRRVTQPARLAIELFRASETIQVTITGSVGSEYILQSGLDLESWTDLQTATIGDAATAQLTIPTPATSVTFFRVISRE
jgi:uncharacterized repeat protein (TIGR02543 family)